MMGFGDFFIFIAVISFADSFFIFVKVTVSVGEEH